MAERKVKWFNDAKTYRFIEQNGGGEIFAHHSAIQGVEYKSLKEGDRVGFEIKIGSKDPAADQVVRLRKTAWA